jgi:hypothetical protein
MSESSRSTIITFFSQIVGLVAMVEEEIGEPDNSTTTIFF